MLDFFLGNGEIVGRENSQVSQLAWGESSLFSIFRRKPTAPHGVELECFFTVQSVLLRIEAETPDGLAGDKPVEGEVRVIARNAGCVGSAECAWLVVNRIVRRNILLERPCGSARRCRRPAPSRARCCGRKLFRSDRRTSAGRQTESRGSPLRRHSVPAR